MADYLALGEATRALVGLAALLSFLGGAMSTAILVNWGRRLRLRSQYALPLMFEAVLLLLFGATRLPQLGASMGSAIRNFKRSFNSEEGDAGS